MISPSRLLVMLSSLLLIGCQPIPSPRGTTPTSDPSAVAIVQQAAAVQGDVRSLSDVSVQYDGRWLSGFLIAVQPTLIDLAFRQGSQERYLISTPAVGQEHRGPGGKKHVVRLGSEIAVCYNGQAADQKDVLDAAALVTDAYRMFLLGPAFFLERNAILQSAGAGSVDGADCDQVLAILRPGIGRSIQDLVLISIGQKDRRIKRVRFTLDGLESTRGAIADVYLRDPVRIAGVEWPTSFFEQVIQPVTADAHRWRLVGIDVNRGMDLVSLGGPTFVGPATRPAGFGDAPASPALAR